MAGLYGYIKKHINNNKLTIHILMSAPILKYIFIIYYMNLVCVNHLDKKKRKKEANSTYISYFNKVLRTTYENKLKMDTS